MSCAASSPADVETLVEVLARAFDDDPVPQWLFRGDRRRRRGLRTFFAIQLRHTYLERGEVFTTQDLAGAALWAPPGRARPGWRDLVRLVPVMPYLTGLGRDTPEAARLLSAVDAARPQEPHWYLATLGTDPDRQRTGVGSALLRSVLDGVDAEGLPAYLESSKESNLAFYGQPRVRGDRRDPHPPGRSHAVVDVEEGRARPRRERRGPALSRWACPRPAAIPRRGCAGRREHGVDAGRQSIGRAP